MSEVNVVKKKRGRKSLTDESRWTDKELQDFIGALQRYGSRDTKHIASAVKTKSESDVKAYIEREVARRRSKLYKGSKQRRQDICTVHPDLGTAEKWPAARKWQKIAQNQMMQCLRNVEYSRLVMPKVWERFRDEQPPPESLECVDIRSIYAYIAACFKGAKPPPELPPKESASLLMLFKTLKEISGEMDTREEWSFIRYFKEATKFVPLQVKDEFRKKGKKDDVVVDKGCVPIPEDMYMGLNRHKKLVQSFNPLTVPLWLLEKQQNFVTQMYEDI